ncbi:MAG TPA: HisA/HisF-related TIM barrel protein [Candidatus Desulfobacillus sp.]|nr:HisA/HisF-related TIM barrel protein [Candidatus Desulfobacillus sp.]
MRILPVLDLRDGLAVHAVAGTRERYRPLRSPLVADASPMAAAAALLELAPFAAFYVADLDAITGNGSRRNFAVLRDLGALLGRRGVRELWLDAGRAAWTGELAAALAAVGVRLLPVIGSESLATGEQPQQLAPGARPHALSLDHRGGAFIGPRGLDFDAASWPPRVLAMELSGVGTRRGPPLALLAALRRRALSAGRADIAFYAGGGVRDADDLGQLANAGAAGALVATALHDGSLGTAALRRFAEKAAA